MQGDAGQVGRSAGWGRLLRATAARPPGGSRAWPWPGLGAGAGAREGGRDPALGAQSGRKDFRIFWAPKAPALGSTSLFLQRAGAGPEVPWVVGRALARVGSHLRKPEIAYKGDLFLPRISSQMSSDEKALSLS